MSLSKLESKYFYDPLYTRTSRRRQNIIILYYSDQIELYERNFGTEKEAFGNGKLFVVKKKRRSHQVEW